MMPRQYPDYGDWLKELNQRCFDRLSVGLSDLPDMPFAVWYDMGCSVGEAMHNIESRLSEDGSIP